MSPPSDKDKRRAGTTSAHPIRSAHAHLPSSRSSNVNANTSSSSSSVIAPPPRAQLNGPGSSPSPGPDNSSSSGHGPEVGSGSGGSAHGHGHGPKEKDSAAALAVREKETLILLKEKDERIAHLEREMAIMETEFSKELDRLSQNESETASFWQTKHSGLNQQFLRTDTELRLLRKEVEVREGERAELREDWEALRRECRERDEEIRALRAQVRGLKEWVSTSTRTGGQVSDEVFGDGMARLGNGLQNWVIVHFRRAKLDVSKADEATIEELSHLVPMFEVLHSTAKVHLLQSIVSMILLENIFESYFVGLSKEQASQLKQTEKFLATMSSAEAVNQWRASTLTILKREAPEKLQAETSAVTERVISSINKLLDSITDATATELRDQALRILVNNSIELARQLVVQKALFKVTMPIVLPHQRIMFDPMTMEDIGGEDEDKLAQREICCVTFPGITKSGDENGSHPQFRNVISKARVLCSPE